MEKMIKLRRDYWPKMRIFKKRYKSALAFGKKLEAGGLNLGLDYLLGRPLHRPYLLKLKNNYQFMVSSWEGAGPINSILLRHDYGELRGLGDGVIVDLGSHIGAFSIYAAKRYPEKKVFGFEPHCNNYQLNINNIALNNLQNINMSCCAISGKTGEAYLSDYGETKSQSHKLGSYTKTLVKVKTITIDNVFGRFNSRCAFLKMDIEGSEYEVLLSATKQTLSRIDKMIIELHHQTEYSPNCLKEHLEKQGFDVAIQSIGNYPHLKVTRRSFD